MTRDEILLSSACMEDFFNRNRVRLSSEYFKVTYPDSETVSQLTDWTSTPERLIFNITGPYFEGDESENPMSMLAAKLVELAVRSKVPVVSYFCDLVRRKDLRVGNTQEVQSLVSIIYSLIRQLLELVAPILETNEDFGADRFQKLDGTLESLDDALVLLHDVRLLLPGKVLCVIDGVQWTDTRLTAKHMKSFINILRKGKMKVLLITSGDSRGLQVNLNHKETFAVQDSRKSSVDDLVGLDEGSVVL